MRDATGEATRRSEERRRLSSLSARTRLAALVVAAGAVIFGSVWLSGAWPSGATSAPVDLTTPVDMTAGVAHAAAVVRVGHARIEVLTSTLLRLEYSPIDTFEDGPTVNVLDRRLPVPRYRATTSGGWLTVTTSRVTLRYRLKGGPFSAADTTVRFADGSATATAHPTWDWECPFDQTCQAGSALLAGGATPSFAQSGYESSAGYVGDLTTPGAAATWDVLGAPAGRATLSIRYAAVAATAVAGTPRTPMPRTMDLDVDGRRSGTVTFAPTGGAQPWSTVGAEVALRPGTDDVRLVCDRGDRCGVDLDGIALGPAGAPPPEPAQTGPLGGWVRGFDTDTYGVTPTCAPGTAGATCDDTFEPLHTDGLLDRAGWRLLDDTRSALWTAQGWVRPRPAGGDVEDGYLFAYGQDYAGALGTFSRLTGPAPLLPRNVFGVWYSDYTSYSARSIEDTIYPGFVEHGVPLDTLSLDTDWKSPNNWDGWEWDTSLFPHPATFVRWLGAHGIDLTLNIHSSVALDDPQLGLAESTAGGTLPESGCTEGLCKVWDWSSPAQAESNFVLQQPLQRQGVSFFWLDWCCDDSYVSMAGLTPDAWIGHLYAQQMLDEGQRGFVLARIGSSNGNPQREYPAGPWSDHTSAIAFTGDAWGTWSTLAQEVALTPDEASIGEPYVSDDVGSYLGPPPGGQDPPDLYDRWVQFGTFSPILRLHSNDENRLPWEFPQPVQGIAEGFLRLRQALVPYTYTLAAQAHRTGLPITQPLYLDYPGQPDAYAFPDEYLYGSDVLVAPVTAPGSVARTTLWLPPGRWVDYFTGATLTGPGTVTVNDPLSRMPVFVRAGGIVPEDPSTAPAGGHHPLDIMVFSGSRGRFDLYGDSGTGLGYTRGQFTTTPITDAVGTNGDSSVAIGPARGRYPGAPRTMAYRVQMVDVTPPSTVNLDGRLLGQQEPGSSAPGWSYQPSTATLVVDTPALATSRGVTVVATGAGAVDRSEPATAPS